MSRPISALERERLGYAPNLPEILRGGIGSISVEPGEPTGAMDDESSIRGRFPLTFGRPVLRVVAGSGPEKRRALRVGVVLSGGQAPGGHNVICGLFDGLEEIDSGSRLHGFLGGPRGILRGEHRPLTAELMGGYRNTGGFDMIGSGRDKIETDDQLAASAAAARQFDLDGLVVIGGDDSNTNAAVLAEYFLASGLGTVVVGVPKTIDGDLKGHGVEASFGFDTATRVYSELIGNICRDAKSAGKYWHFIKLMGRSASHVTLECALRTQPNVALIGEEVRAAGATLEQVANGVAEVVRRRADAGKQYGVCLVPEGLIEFIPEMRTLIDELNALVADRSADEEPARFADGRRSMLQRLSDTSAPVFDALPERIQRQLLLDRDSHGNVLVSQIETERFLAEQVRRRLESSGFTGAFRVQDHFFGYEGRCAAPSNFDADYTYALGRLAATLIAFARTGYICSVRQLFGDARRWQPTAVPLTSMMQIETRGGRPTPVIGKALVRTDREPFFTFAALRESWILDDVYLYPGAIQYFGPPEVSNRPTATLLLEAGREASRGA